ncbi:hypothetical protein GCM10027406_27100 [Leifsonia lichenia]
MRLRLRIAAPVLLAALAAPLILSSSASAATTSQWAGWAPLTGTSNNYTTTVTVANNPPLIADVTSDSRSGSVGVISGASTWLAAATPVGAKYGSSQGKPYLNLRPRADNATSPSTTTYSFRTPTPTSGWTFVLGDIDADKVQVRALGPDGVPLTAAQLGYRSSFNYCVPGVCTPTQTPADVPAWDPATRTLSGDPVTNPKSLDTAGASAWFEPNAPIASLTFVYTRVTGFPVFQTWFASLARDISGTVTDANTGPLDGVPVTLTDANGTVVGTATTSGGGHYAFPGFLATSGYTVSITPPLGKIAVTAATAPADLSAADAVVDFAVRDIVPVAVSGTVKDANGQPIAGATVTIGTASVTTNPDGSYLFDTVPVGTHQALLTVPDGYTLSSGPLPFTIPQGSSTPITGQDFVVAANPTISGAVTASGDGVGGVTVTATGPGGSVSAVTAADGSYSFPRIPAGSYTVTVTPPDGLVTDGAGSLPVTVATTDVTGVDFALAKTGDIAGTVLDTTGAGVAGATVTIDGPAGTATVTTDPSGAYGATGLVPGTYTIDLTLPDGYTTTDPLTKTVTITAAGETFGAEDYTVVAPVVVPPTTPPTTPPVTPPATPGPGTGTAGTGSGSGDLAATGSVVDATPALLAAAALLVAGAWIGVGRLARRRRT